jgi:ABC-type cobalamin/Fe3+-siderophores transport system ATPase subunit
MAALARVNLDGLAREPAVRLDREERARLALARALCRRPEHLVVRDADVVLGVPDAERLLGLIQTLVQADRLLAVASVSSLSLASQFADRVVVLADGLLILDAPPGSLAEGEVAWRLRGAPTGSRLR